MFPKNFTKTVVKIYSVYRHIYHIQTIFLSVYNLNNFVDLKKRISKAINAFLEDDNAENDENNNHSMNDECIEKGNEFETFVVNRFDDKYFSIVEWSTDIMRKHDRYVESDSKPDLTMRYVPTGEKFCIECKFRANLFKGALQWSKYDQLQRYKDFHEKSELPLFIVIGLGGIPSNPKRLFCIPIREAKYPKLYPSIFENYERETLKPFFWKNGYLK